MKRQALYEAFNRLDESLLDDAENCPKVSRRVLPYILAAAACVCAVAAVLAAFLIPALKKPEPRPTGAIPSPTPTEAVTPTPVAPSSTPASEPSPGIDNTLMQRKWAHDPDVVATSVDLYIPGFDEALRGAQFVVVAKYAGWDKNEYRYRFEVVGSYNDDGSVHAGDLLYTDIPPYDCILTDIVTGKKQIMYMNLMGPTPYRVGKPYILLGFYDRDTGKPILYYGMRVTSDNLTFAEWYGKNLFNDPTGEFPPCAFQPDKNTPAEEFLAYCIENVGKE